jgi:hypothetical protein
MTPRFTAARFVLSLLLGFAIVMLSTLFEKGTALREFGAFLGIVITSLILNYRRTDS